jgi:hypothetical protein
MLLAGEDTISNTLAWMMYMMTEHPAVQVRMQDEADRILGSAQREHRRTPLPRGGGTRNGARLEPIAPRDTHWYYFKTAASFAQRC